MTDFDVAATAIHRKQVSAPVKWICQYPDIADSLSYSSVMNFGGGHAVQDTAAFSSMGAIAHHFDPYVLEHNSIGIDTPFKAQMIIDQYLLTDHYMPNSDSMVSGLYYDFVYAGYVLNVIAEPFERRKVLNVMNMMCTNSDWAQILVAVRSDKVDGTPYGDGVVTKRNTFQKSYTNDEFMREFADFDPELVHDGGHYLLYRVLDSGDDTMEMYS